METQKQTTETYKTTKSYKEATELFKNIENVDPKDTDSTIAALTYQTVNTINSSNVAFLENLTGLELNTKEKLYDYYTKNIVYTSDFIADIAFAQLLESSKESSDFSELNDLINTIKSLKKS